MSAPRILLVRYSAIGDCVMAAWAATSIRRRYPDAFVLWAVESRCAPVVDRQTLVSQAAEVPRDRWKRKRWSPATWQEEIALYARLRRQRFDWGVDFQGHSKTAICLRLANPRRRLAARSTDSLSARLNPQLEPIPTGIHTVAWNQRTIEAFGSFELPERPIMPLRPELWEAIRDRFEGRPLASISVSAGHPDKAYPAANWHEVAQGLLARGFAVAFLGGPTDSPIELPGTHDLVRKLPLESTMAVVANSRIHLCGDTGTGHMAAAYGVPVVSVFGPTDPCQFRPYTTNGIVLHEGPETAQIAPRQVLDAVREVEERSHSQLPH